MSVEKYSPSSNNWSEVAFMFDKRSNFCACAFMDKIYIIGGFSFNDRHKTTNSCLRFNTVEKNWNEVCAMIEVRKKAACAIFQGNIVVTGGIDNNAQGLNSVESYDVFANKWTPLPNMQNFHSNHSLVTVKNKLFVIDGNTNICEVFDNICKKFITLKSPYGYISLNKAMSIGNIIVLFLNEKSSTNCYDVEKDEWSDKSCEITKYIDDFSCTKIPWY